MRTTLRCPRCAGQSFWHVDPVREWATGVVDMAVAFDASGRGIGTFELLACRRCGVCAWYACSLGEVAGAAADVAPLTTADARCVECGGSRLLRIGMKDALGGRLPLALAALPDAPSGSAAGVLTTIACEDCGRTEWFTDSPQALAHPFHVLGESSDACARCGRAGLTRVRARDRNNAVDSEGRVNVVDRALAMGLTLLGYRLHGGMELAICPACGLTEWFAVGIEGLKEDPRAGLTLVEGTAAEPAGPYR